MKVTLICPKWDKGLNRVSLFRIPSMAIRQLASLTPLSWDVEILDENFQSIDFEKPTDLVGITAMTALAPRAYEIAREYRKRGVKTIMGGIHSSMRPNEAILHVDSVVVGEADLMWPQILRDFEKEQLRERYDCELPVSLDFPLCRGVSQVFPCSFAGWKVRFAYVQAQRGCPNNCEFCSVRSFNGPHIRKRTIPYLMGEIGCARSERFDYLCFTDDNLVADKGYARHLFSCLKPLHVRWFSQVDIRIADDDLLDLACKSGLSAVLLGLESLNVNTLRGNVGGVKTAWRRRYEEAIAKLHDRGVLVYASFIFGFDGEDPESAEEVVRWATENRIEIVQFSILTPMPGTQLFSRLYQAGRIQTFDWAHYNTLDCVFEPSGCSKDDLEARLDRAYQKMYSWYSIVCRINRAPFRNLAISLISNWEFSHLRR